MKRIWKSWPHSWGAIMRLSVALIAVMSMLITSAPPSVSGAGLPGKPQRHEILRSPVTLDQEQDLPNGRRPGGPIRIAPVAKTQLHEPSNLNRQDLDNARTGAVNDSRVKRAIDPDMKILVISADGSDFDFAAIKLYLDQIGVPYDALVAKNQPFSAATLSDGVSHGYYDGIVLTSGSLIYYDPNTNTYPSALSASQWQDLWTYEAQYGVRQVTMFTAPGFVNPDPYGLTFVGETDTTTTPVTATLTATGKQVFSYLNTASPITIKNAWVYFANSPDATTTPLLTTSQGYVLASLHTYADGRQNMALTMANNPYFIHSMLLSYGMINWVTKGVFLGERHVNIGPQIDDLFIEDGIWDPSTKTDTSGIIYRNTGADWQAAINWQAAEQAASTLTRALRLEWAFNGEGAQAGYWANDTLVPAVLANSAPFNFINHTFSHQNLDYVDPDNGNMTPVTYAHVLQQLTDNQPVATNQFHFNRYNKNSLVQPDISGLLSTSTQSRQAMYDFGVRYIISDTSRVGWNNPSPNAGFVLPDQPNILIVPRRPSNLFYNLMTPDQWVSEYNCYYGPTGTCAAGAWRFWDHDLSYQEILDKESDVLLGYMLRWDLDPLMFHTPNQGAYDGTHSLMGDVLHMTLTKYKAAYNLPIRNMALREIGPKMADRMAYNASGVKASVACQTNGTGTMTISTVKPATIPVTGLVYGTNRETYGGQTISYIALAANQTLSIPAPAAACTSGEPAPVSSDLSITNSDGVDTLAPGAPATYTIVATNTGAAVTGATLLDSLPADLTNVTWTCQASGTSTCGVASGTGNVNVVVNLDSGGTATVSVLATVASSPAGVILSNAASISAPVGTTDPTPANNSATDTDTIAAPLPALTLRDAFNRSNSVNLGGNWSQTKVLSVAAIQVNAQQASAPTQAGIAVWNGNSSSFGARQGASFTFANTPVTSGTVGTSLILKASGGTKAAPANYIQVAYLNGQVTISTTTNSGTSVVTRGTFPATFTTGQTLAAVAYADGSVAVYKTAGTTTTMIGAVAIPTSGTNAWTQGTKGGRIGIYMPVGARTDNFSARTIP